MLHLYDDAVFASMHGDITEQYSLFTHATWREQYRRVGMHLDKHVFSITSDCAFQMQSWSDTDRRCYGGTGITLLTQGGMPLSFSCPRAEGEMLTCSWPSQNSKWRICTNVAGVLLSLLTYSDSQLRYLSKLCALLANILQTLHCIVHLYITAVDSIAVAESNSACSSGFYEVTNPLRAA